ncbi:MAG: type II secretion system inner membrane protein GspF [bacterium]|nr:type II secretion system inner membrane protein GspF [bacterium]MCP5067905.1 type II secretion system inner membrane protein GspF [bacterium]
MPVYQFKGVIEGGRATKGFVDADSDRTARQKLRRDGVFLTELLESSGAASPSRRSSGTGMAKRMPTLFSRVSGTDLALATRQLATLLAAGIPLVESLGALTEQIESARLKSVFGIVRDRVNEGASLADAMASVGPFNNLFVSMVRAGETGGALETVLDRLADYLEGQVRTTNKVISILLYPAVMMMVAVGVVVVLVTIVLPQITQLLESLDRELPIYTRIVIDFSDFLRNWWWAVLLGLLATGTGLRRFIASERGRFKWDGFLLRVPLVGKIVRQLAISRFTRTLATLLAGGIPIVRSLDISRHVAANAVIGEAVEEARTSITGGASIAGPLRASGQFPPLVTHMVDVGERSGDLAGMLSKVADTYEEQVENTVTRITALLEPFLILVMVGVVMVIMLSTIMPLLDLTSSIQ